MSEDYPILEFDPEREAVVEPARVVAPIDAPEHCVLCFFEEVIDGLLEGGRARLLKELESEMGAHPLYETDLDGRRLAVIHPGVGAPLAGALLEEVIALGCRKFVACGSSGVLDSAIAAGHVDLTDCQLPRCDLAVSAYAFHRVPPGAMPDLFGRIATALRPGGCFILADQMLLGPRWGERTAEQVRRVHREHTAAAIRDGRTTQEEVDARWELKRQMKQAGKDVEYWHDAEDLCAAMRQAGLAEAGIMWRMLRQAILMAFAGG